jgi:hypothetical protein
MHATQVDAEVELRGGPGDDTLIGGDGLDILAPGYGRDGVDVGGRQCELSFAGLRGRLDVDLVRQIATGTGVGDTLDRCACG